MQPVGLHCNYFSGTGAEKNPAQLLRLFLEAGASAMDFSTATALQLTSDERRSFGKNVRAAGIAMSLNGGIADAEISHTDPAVRQDGLSRCYAAIEAAAELGCSVWSGVIYAKWLGLPDGPLTREKKAEMWERAIHSVRALCTYAQPLGINVCLEIVNRFEAYLINTASDGLRMIQDVGCSNLKLLLDVFHMNIEEDSMLQALHRTIQAECLGHLHISESNRRLPGLYQTDLNWSDILGVIANSSFAGSVILESMVLSQSPAAYGFRTWRDMTDHPTLDGLVADAQQSIQFVQNCLKTSRKH